MKWSYSHPLLILTLYWAKKQHANYRGPQVHQLWLFSLKSLIKVFFINIIIIITIIIIMPSLKKIDS